jgi:hypothetical protein
VSLFEVFIYFSPATRNYVYFKDQECVGKKLRDMEVRGKRDRGRPKVRYVYGQSETRFERDHVGSQPRQKPNLSGKDVLKEEVQPLGTAGFLLSCPLSLFDFASLA